RRLTGARISGDQVAGAGRRTADGIAGGLQFDSPLVIGDRVHAGHVGADVVAFDEVAGDPRLAVADPDADVLVAGDDVARGSRRAADGYVGDGADALAIETAVAEDDPRILIGHGGGARGVGTDEIAFDGDIRGSASASTEVDAEPVIAGDDVAGDGA